MYSKTSNNPVKKITACPLAGESWWLEWAMAIVIMMISTLQVVLWREGGNLGQPGSATHIGNFILWMGNLLLWGYFDSFLKPQGPINPNNHHHDVGHSSVSGFSVRSQSTKAWVCYSSGFGWLSSLWLQKQPTSLYSNEFRQLHLFYRARRWDVGLNQLQPPSPR